VVPRAWGSSSSEPRADIFLSAVDEDTDADHYRVETREGGTEGRIRQWDLPTRDLAERQVAELKAAEFADDWRDMTGALDLKRPK
jgi:hypothetical protein